ncbi:ExbD/TolR family protein [Pontimicrobium sp. MEBiC01747]
MKKRLLIYLVLLVIAVVLMLTLKRSVYNSKYNNGIDLVLPEVEGLKPKAKPPLEINVRRNGKYLIGKNEVEKDSLELKMINFILSEDYKKITIKSDQDVEMKHVIYVMDIANRNGIPSVLAVRNQD